MEIETEQVKSAASGEYLELRIPISANTTKKIVALAALTGQSLGQIKETIASELIDEEAFDVFVSSKLRMALSEMDGHEEEEEEPSWSARGHQQSKFAQAEQDSQDDIVEDLAGHSISGDEDEGAPSLEEQYKAEERRLRSIPPVTVAKATATQSEDIIPPELDVEDVGGNVEAFLDSALATPGVGMTTGNSRFGRATGTLGSFNPQRRRASVSDYTGDEDNLF